MSTVQEIQEAIAQLPEEERMTLLQWIHLHEESDQIVDDPSRSDKPRRERGSWMRAGASRLMRPVA